MRSSVVQVVDVAEGVVKGRVVVSLADDESGIAAEQPRRHSV